MRRVTRRRGEEPVLEYYSSRRSLPALGRFNMFVLCVVCCVLCVSVSPVCVSVFACAVSIVRAKICRPSGLLSALPSLQQTNRPLLSPPSLREASIRGLPHPLKVPRPRSRNLRAFPPHLLHPRHRQEKIPRPVRLDCRAVPVRY